MNKTWDWEFAIAIFPEILSAITVTIAATIIAYCISLTAGLVLTLLRRASFKPLALTVAGIIEFIRATPPLVQLFFVYYTTPLTGFQTGAIVLGLHYATYVSEIYRSGIEAVPKSQWEASKALNFTRAQTWRRIILPQAIPPVIPMLGNYLIVLFKETPLLSAIFVVEMMAVAQSIGTSDWRYVEPITIVGFLFLALSYPSAAFIRYLERKVGTLHGNKIETRGVKT
ncbi:ectoine/hydroxyectoine ABC transporter permease subunit EhuD [Shouchella clausii]|jgi:polar amino acid transport system permease protein|uniref:Ectoine/hydroxyectoine ABC transporter permease subunit EhuD n=1 Tax=Shouchella clausii TaxID=79880 RepID=A0A268RY44_SHOCL|nr:ectoine/hydroxyectoine ABC transporter permease subunit EhuD [Shouchella clausii]PAD41671.1 ectoine/hydroxyectoine ABC transporter permease subunit EhuD [Bacillus sp. 7520-S]SPT81822.1 amino acid ABC transporter permease [Niallia circulans]AST94771.1 ectoine/hydroxyectoine ABC transporter permease subunit EhuD [Shouchella clausii]MBU8597792.1 ectoine/hydroxyectoine ABC transporter permease subunit EhuD [Shouchella clausii]MCM3550180.1 ectoine/hydroxyectoine ABC transporter permease subunit 